MFEFLSKPIVLEDVNDAHVQQQQVAVLVHRWYAGPVERERRDDSVRWERLVEVRILCARINRMALVELVRSHQGFNGMCLE